MCTRKARGRSAIATLGAVARRRRKKFERIGEVRLNVFIARQREDAEL